MPRKAAPVTDKVVAEAHDELHVRQVEQVNHDVQHLLERTDSSASTARHLKRHTIAGVHAALHT